MKKTAAKRTADVYEAMTAEQLDYILSGAAARSDGLDAALAACVVGRSPRIGRFLTKPILKAGRVSGRPSTRLRTLTKPLLGRTGLLSNSVLSKPEWGASVRLVIPTA